jgi:hypothetical protein
MFGWSAAFVFGKNAERNTVQRIQMEHRIRFIAIAGWLEEGLP